ncbi:P12 family lipoprotein (plasmid) [Borrelia nietonii YOR]|nr:P12 family lipoprotein [Borrelia nietonii]UPA10063.1 P12 family lipoprotein [Borrelia nietonii YOR]UPA10087.1 P12 family lipoprotein [Borrelia nietonii YOR]
MKKSILTVCMFILLCLLSCDINALNDLLGEAREKFLDGNKNNKDLHYIQGNQDIQEEQEEIVNGLEERERIQQDIEVEPVVPVNKMTSVFQYSQAKIEIKEEDLIPNTKEEKEAEAEIEKVKSVLEKSGFQQLIENAHKLKSEYEQLESDLHGTFAELQTKLQEQIDLKKVNLRNNSNRTKIQRLKKLQNQLKISFDLERLISQVDSGLSGLESARFFFEKAQKSLKEAITERLENELRKNRFLRRVNGNLPKQLSREARRYAENSLEQLESSSLELNEAMAKKEEIKKLIEGAKSYLASLVR